MKALHFHTYRSGVIRKQWRWTLIAANGRKLASGEGFRNKKDMLDSIALVQGSGGAIVTGEAVA